MPLTAVHILTVHDDPDCLWEAITAGAAGYALKTSTPQELLEAVRRVLRGEWPFDQELAVRLLRHVADETYRRKESVEPAPRTRTPPPEKYPEAPLSHAGSAGSPSAPLTASLTAREVEILRLVAEGLTNRQIAQKLSVARNTARNHVQNVITKLGVSDRTQAAVRAIELGLLSTNHKKEEL
jgi:DNA-binding NarL/FixJ family response regulator